jgi:hypothetical protein
MQSTNGSSPDTRPRSLRPFRLAVTAACLVAVPACSSGTPNAAGTSTTSTIVTSNTSTSTTAAPTAKTSPQTTAAATSPTTAAPTTAAPTTVALTTTSGNGACTSGSTVVPSGAVSRQIVDVDGDGRPDTAWIGTDTSGSVMVGVVTAAGGGTVRSFDSPSPGNTRSVLAFHLNDATPPIFLAADSRTVLLWAFIDCTLVDVHNLQGDPYEFSLGFTDIGTGVGCATVDGTQQLVGLDAKTDTNGDIDWSSTVVTVRGDKARNATVTNGVYTSPTDDSKIALLDEVTCGTLTMGNDGITLSG